MNLSISGHHVDITDSLHNYVEEKFNKITHHFDNIIGSSVVLNVEKNRHIAEATVDIKGTTIHASSEAEDMYVAIRVLVDKLDRQMLSHKKKTIRHH